MDDEEMGLPENLIPIDIEKFRNKIILGVVAMAGYFAIIYFMLHVILSDLKLGSITWAVFILLLLLMFRPRKKQEVIFALPHNLLGSHKKENIPGFG